MKGLVQVRLWAGVAEEEFQLVAQQVRLTFVVPSGKI